MIDMQIHSWVQQITVIAVCRRLQDLTVNSLHLTSFTDCAADWLRPAEALRTNHVLFQKEPMHCSVRIKAVALNLSRLDLITGNRSKTVLWRSLALEEVMFLFFYIKFSRREPQWSKSPVWVCLLLLAFVFAELSTSLTVNSRIKYVARFRRRRLTLSFKPK